MAAQSRYVEVELGDVIIFFDPRFQPDPGSGTLDIPAVNRVAVVVDDSHALFLYRNKLGFKRVGRFPLGRAIEEGQNLTTRKSPFGNSNELIVEFFLKARDKPNVFEAGMRALHAENLSFLLTGKLFPDPPVYRDEAHYLSAWAALTRSLQPLDSIFTRDNESSLSRFIAWSTHGPWSHVATHVSNGEIFESVTSGIRRTSIDIYKGRRYRIGVYRSIGLLDMPVTAERANAIVSSHPFRPNAYNYRQAVRYGLRSFLGDHSHGLVPNSSIYQGHYVLIAQA